MAAETSFVGRLGDLESLSVEFARAETGEPRFVLVVGEAGIGKSVLLHRFASSVAATVLRASGDESERDLSFAVIDQLARGVTGPLPPALVAIGKDAALALEPVTVGAALIELFGDLQADASVVIVIDDMHWADLPSLQALSFAARRLVADRLLLILVCRSDELDRVPRSFHDLAESRGRRLTLSGLTAAELIDLAAAIGAETLSGPTAIKLFEHTRGNPLFARAMLDDGLPADDWADGSPMQAPSVYTDMVSARLDTCPDRARRLLYAAAAMGGQSPLSLAASVATLSDAMPALDEAIRTGLIESQGHGAAQRIRFTHPLNRSAAYHHMSPHARRELHLVVSERATDRGTSLRHRLLAASGPDDALASALEVFATDQLARGSVAEAAWAMRAAAPLSTGSAEQERRALYAIELAVTAGDAAAVGAVATMLAGCADSPRSRYINGMLAVVTGRQAEGEAALLSAREALGDPPSDADLAGAIGGWLAPLFVNGGRAGHSVDWARAAIRRQLEGRVAWPNLAIAPVGLAGAGHVDEALSLTEPIAGEAELDRGGVDLLTGRAVVEIWIEDFAGAWRDLHVVLSTTRQRGPFVDHLIALFYLGDVAYRLGRFDDAVTYGGLAASAGEDAEQPWVLALVHAVASWPLAARGDWQQAARHAEASTAAAATLGADDLAAKIWSAMARARLAHARRQPAGVVSALGSMGESRYQDGLWSPGVQPWQALYAEALVQLDRLDDAALVLDRLDELLTDPRLLRAKSEAARVRGLLHAARGQHASAEDCFAAALSRTEGIEATFTLARTEAAVGKYLRRRGRRRSAAEHLHQARAKFVRLRATPYAEEMTDELAACGQTVAVLGPGSPTGLTPQEVAVANLVCQGLSNKETAARLVVSVKTVEYHLGHAYAKLQVRTRSELVRRLLREGTPNA